MTETPGHIARTTEPDLQQAPRATTGWSDAFGLRSSGVIYALFVVLILIIGLSGADGWPFYLRSINVANLPEQTALLGIIAVEMALLPISGSFDLSVGSMAALSAIVAAMATNLLGPVAGNVTGLCVGTAGGLVNGLLHWIIGLNPFILTPGTLSVYGGLALVVSDGRTVAIDDPSSAAVLHDYTGGYLSEFNLLLTLGVLLGAGALIEARLNGRRILEYVSLCLGTALVAAGLVTDYFIRISISSAFWIRQWVGDIIHGTLWLHRQGTDGRIDLAIPHETDLTLMGTTDQEHADPSVKPVCTPAEKTYLPRFASDQFKKPVTDADVVRTCSCVRPLYDDAASSATPATRDYTFKVDTLAGASVLNEFGGEITTYCRLAEHALEEIAPILGEDKGGWTAGAPLPCGGFAVSNVGLRIGELCGAYPFLTDPWARRFVRPYGTEARDILADDTSAEDLGANFCATPYKREARWLMTREFAQCAEDVGWRRSKLGLRLSDAQIAALDTWMAAEQGAGGIVTAPEKTARRNWGRTHDT